MCIDIYILLLDDILVRDLNMTKVEFIFNNSKYFILLGEIMNFYSELTICCSLVYVKGNI